MNNEKKRRAYSRQLGVRIFLRYLLTLALAGAGVVGVALLGRAVASRINWQQNDWFYHFLLAVNYNLPIAILITCIVVWVVVSLVFLIKPFRYLDSVINAAKELAAPTEEMIALPRDLSNVQEELNQIRVTTLRSNYLAKEAEQRKNDLIVYLAHDLKTPLTSVIGYLTLLRDEPEIPEKTRQRYTDIAWNKAQRLEDLVNEFFEITRLNLSTMTLEEEQVNLSRMLEQIASEFLPALEEKRLSWRLDVQPDIRITCDPDKLARVFDNLIRNAVNYSYVDTEITLSAREEQDGVRVVVANRGKTIPPEKLARIFEQFFRLDSSRSTSTGGAGLGLAIAKEIVELHGGVISAASSDESIVFTVVLPKDRKKNVSFSKE